MIINKPTDDIEIDEEFDPFDDSITTVCFTGHREIPGNVLPAVHELLSEFLASLYARGARVFKAGGAVGFDTAAAQAVIDLKAATGDRDIKLWLCLPARDQADHFSEYDRLIYNMILNMADEVTYVSGKSNTESYLARDRKLVEGSDVCVAYCTKQKGGTYYTCRQALSEGLEFINLADFIETE